MTCLDIHYEMRRHGLKSQQLAAVLGLPPNDVIFKLYGETELSLYEIEQLVDLFGCFLGYLVGHCMVARAYSPGEGVDNVMRG